MSGLLLTFSGIGFMPLYGRFSLNDLPGMAWVSDFTVQLNLHYVSAGSFMAACLFHALYHWWRGEYAALPRKGDLSASWATIKAMLSNRDEPPHEKFLAEQRLAYATFVVTVMVLVVTGYILAAKNALGLILDPALIQVLILTHMGCTFLFVFQVLLHISAFMLKVNRPLFLSMLTGRVCRKYAFERHPLWIAKDKD